MNRGEKKPGSTIDFGKRKCKRATSFVIAVLFVLTSISDTRYNDWRIEFSLPRNQEEGDVIAFYYCERSWKNPGSAGKVVTVMYDRDFILDWNCSARACYLNGTQIHVHDRHIPFSFSSRILFPCLHSLV